MRKPPPRRTGRTPRPLMLLLRSSSRWTLTSRTRPRSLARMAIPLPIRATDSSDGVVRLRLDLRYDGSEFHGWAGQPSVRTVQGVLEHALTLALRLAQPPVLTVAGRTDAGVHARGQVAHVDVPATSWLETGQRALSRLNRLLPPDVRVREVQVAADGFDARFSALWRRYSY